MIIFAEISLNRQCNKTSYLFVETTLNVQICNKNILIRNQIYLVSAKSAKLFLLVINSSILLLFLVVFLPRYCIVICYFSETQLKM